MILAQTWFGQKFNSRKLGLMRAYHFRRIRRKRKSWTEMIEFQDFATRAIVARHIFHPRCSRSWVVVAVVVASSSHRLSRTRRFINVVTSCRRYCRGVSVTTEADVAFLIKRSRRQGSLHCVRIVGGDVGKGLVLTTRRPASLYNPAVDQFQSTTITTTTSATAWRRESERESLDASSKGNDRIFIT